MTATSLLHDAHSAALLATPALAGLFYISCFAAAAAGFNSL